MSPGPRRGEDDFAQALTRALRDNQVTLHGLRALLEERDCKVSAATLSYWQNGRSKPTRSGSIDTVSAIEEVLALPPGTLTHRLRTAGDPTWNPASVLSVQDEADLILEQLGLSWNQPVTGVIGYDMFHTGRPDGNEAQCVRQMVRAEADGIARLPAIFQVTGPRHPEIVVGDGVLLGEVVPLAGAAAVVVEFVLPRTLSGGTYHWFEYEVHWDWVAEPVVTYGRSVKTGHGSLVIGATFHGERPTSARVYHQPTHGAAPPDLARWDGQVPGQVQHAVRNAPAGVYLVEWTPRDVS